MNKHEAHQQIERLTGKIQRLNETLKNDNILEQEEIELLTTYTNNLSSAIAELGSFCTSGPSSTATVEAEKNPPIADFQKSESSSPDGETKARTMEETSLDETEAITNSSLSKKELEDLEDDDKRQDQKIAELQQEIDELEEEQQFESEYANEDPISTTATDDLPDTIANELEMEKEEEKESTTSTGGRQPEEEDDEPTSINDRFKARPDELANKYSNAAAKDLRQYLDLSQKYEFINQLFEGDADYFNRALKRLNESETMADALEYLNTDLYAKFDWDDKQQQVDKLSKLIERKFSEMAK